MSFGLRNAIQTLQRFMDILWGLDFCFAYLDDILVFSQSLELHEHLRTLFNQLQKYGIVNPAMCVFRAPKVTFLDYKVSAKDSQPLEEQVTHLQDCHPQRPLVSSIDFWVY
jgi:hypothetical protein